MNLKLRQAIPGRPLGDSTCPLAGVSAGGVAFAYPSSTNVVLIDQQGQLQHTLSLWDALPHRAGPSGSRDVKGVVARDDMIVAWSGIHVVLWNYTDKWVQHSHVVASAPIASVDYANGMAVLGTQKGVEVWHMDPAADIVVWDRLARVPTAADPLVAVHLSKQHVAWRFRGGRSAYVQALNKKGAVGDAQELRQPREIEWLGFRSATSGDSQLYITTVNAVLRIYAPVLDDPTWFQLLHAMDHRAFAKEGGKGKSARVGTIWVPDAAGVKAAAKAALAHARANRVILEAEPAKALELLECNEMDVAVWFGPDGTVSLRAILNLDRKPPTLIRSEALARIDVGFGAGWSAQGVLVPDTATDTVFLGFPPSDGVRDISTLRLSLVNVLLSDDTALQPTQETDAEAMNVLMAQDIKAFVRTPNGRGLLAIGNDGEVGSWEKRKLGNVPHNSITTPALVGKGQWKAPASPIVYAIYAKGRGVVSYYKDPERGPVVVLQHLDPGDGTPTEPVPMPNFAPADGDEIKFLLAVSDIDDGYSHRRRRTRRAVILAVAESGETWVWRIDPAPTSPHTELSQSPLATPVRSSRRFDHSPDASPVQGTSTLNSDSYIYRSEKPVVTLISNATLPIDGGGKPRFVLPVDPMGWHQSTVDWETDTPLQDMVVTVTDAGVIEFWTPRLGQHLIGQRRTKVDGNDPNAAWNRSSVVRTERKNVVKARCSSRKKTVLVCDQGGGEYEMTIWDSDVSEFSTGLEFEWDVGHDDVIQDLDWTTTSDLQSVLAVGFKHHVILVCEQRMNYDTVMPGWAPFLTIDLTKYTSVPIADSIWIAGGSLAVATGNQIYVFSRFLEAKDDDHEDTPEDIFQLIAHENGPLWDYQPTQLMQCLLWDKIDLVKRILVQLDKDLRHCEDEGKKRLVYERLDPLDFHSTNAPAQAISKASRADYSDLFSVTPAIAEEESNEEFSPGLVKDLVDRLEGPVIMPLTVNEKSSLASLAQATLEVERSRRSLDICGLRYLISIRMFVNHDRLSGPSGATSPAPRRGGLELPNQLRPRPKISFRNIVWATHSESNEVLLQAATESCENGKMMWADAKRLGVFLWLRSPEAILEVVARNEFMSSEDRDPIKCSLFFFALGKKQVVHGLWRQAPGHPEQGLMLKFLANDFTLDRWKTAAMKNAYALLSKKRFLYAAAFFMLAGATKDAMSVCLRQLNDWQLALLLARVTENGTDGPLYRWVLEDTVLPLAFGGGHRWLGSWTLWMLKRRDLAVRVLISPIDEVAAAWSKSNPETGKMPVGNPDNDDPSLLLLFQHLKAKTLQTAKGTSEVPAKLEFDFVLHNARVFCRMGCHPLGLDLLRSWSFARPTFPKRRRVSASPTRALHPTSQRRESFLLTSRRPDRTMLMDMDPLEESGTEPPTEAPTRAPSPPAGPGMEDFFASFSLGDPPKKKANGAAANGAAASPLRQQVASPGDVSPTKVASPGDISPTKAEAPGGDAAGGDADKKDKKDGMGDGKEDGEGQKGAKPEPEDGAPAAPSPKKKVGNLMKELRNDVQQGAMEFNMDNFF